MDNFVKKDGVIEIDLFDYHKINNNLFSFEFDNNKYYFKYIKAIDNIYNELIAEEIAKKYGISNAEYSLASLNDNLGVISKNFVKEGYSYISIESLLKKYIKDNNIEKYNNLDDLISILKKIKTK